MSHWRALAVGFGVAVCSAGVLACGGSDDDKDKGKDKSTSTGTTAGKSSKRAAPLPPVQHAAPLKTTQSVRASSSPGRPKTTLTVKVTKVVRGLQPSNFQFGGSRKGLRFVGVQVTLKNTGRATWSGSPGQASTLLTSSDTQARTMTAAGTCGSAFYTKVELLPDERQRGCVPFVLKKTQKPTRFQFSPDPPATPPVEWVLKK